MFKSICMAAIVLAGVFSLTFSQPAGADGPLIPISKDFTLPNGLRVILSEDHSRPVAAIVTIYDVGSRHEVKGKSGFAHLFEHMMFEGSQNISKSELSHYLDTMGGDVNAQTSVDYTIYYESVPSNMIERIFWVESDRLRSLKVTDENFKNQLETVKEEKRSSYDNRPYMPAYLKMQQMVFDNWANAHPIIGSFTDLESSSAHDAQKFFKEHYGPNKACMAIVGDIDAPVVEELIKKYYGSIARVNTPSIPAVNEVIPGKAKFAIVKDEYAEVPGLFMAWKTPGMRQTDYYAMGLIEKLLVDSGKSSMLYQRLVKKEQTCLDVDNYTEERRGTGNFCIFVTTKPGATSKQIQGSILAEIAKLKAGKISATDLQKAKNQLESDLFASPSDSPASMQSALGRASFLAMYALFFGDPKLVDADIAKYMAVSVSDIQKAARRVFSANAATVVEVKPSGKI
ncbi:MAG: insulinase family protein [Candidatus Obscuribacterales bacterium]|nr:insulinase family protein [Candidatus Obscuribacterales bacterium]